MNCSFFLILFPSRGCFIFFSFCFEGLFQSYVRLIFFLVQARPIDSSSIRSFDFVVLLNELSGCSLGWGFVHAKVKNFNLLVCSMQFMLFNAGPSSARVWDKRAWRADRRVDPREVYQLNRHQAWKRGIAVISCTSRSTGSSLIELTSELKDQFSANLLLMPIKKQ